MQTKPRTTHVLMPDDSVLEASYYCNDAKLEQKEREKLTQLVIQLHDCICSLKINKSVCGNKKELETLVHTKVVNSKGHLC